MNKLLSLATPQSPARRIMLCCGAVAVVALASVLTVRGLKSRGSAKVPPRAPQNGEVDSGEEVTETVPATKVRVIHPKKNRLPSKDQARLVRAVSAPAYVEAYFKADLFSNVAGVVKYIQKNIGDYVSKDELLMEIDVPDLIQDVAQKDALYQQAKAALTAAEADIQTLEALQRTAETAIKEKESDLDREQAQRSFRKLQLERTEKLAITETVAKETVDERRKEYQVSEAACKSAVVSVQKAKLDYEVTKTKVTAARAEMEVKRQKITAALVEKRRVQAQADFAKIRAPFSGVIVARNVDPGSFVQNATSARTQSFLTLMRTDMVTVAMLVPERAAPYVTRDTEAQIYMEMEPGRHIQNLKGKVTRFSPTLDPEKGRTLRVEVDLYNPPERGYRRSVTRGLTSFLAPLATNHSLETSIYVTGGQAVWGRPGLLRPGMYGSIRLILQKFENSYVIPQSALFTQQGKTYLFEVRHEKTLDAEGEVVVKHTAHRLPVRVRYEDGVEAIVDIVEKEADPETGAEEVLRSLTCEMEIIPTGQGELEDSKEVDPVEDK